MDKWPLVFQQDWKDRRAPCILKAGFLALWIVFLSANNSIAHIDGPPPGNAGGFDDDTCFSCHFDGPLNDTYGSLKLNGIPENYYPQTEYLIEIVLTHPKIVRGGFQLVIRFGDGTDKGQQAGSMESVDGRVEIVTERQPVLQFAQQIEAGSFTEESQTARWRILWKAPANPSGAIIFNAAANASNYDESALGDFIYTQEFRSRKPQFQELNRQFF